MKAPAVACSLLLAAVASPLPGAPALARPLDGIFHVLPVEERYELRVHHPLRGTRTVLEASGEPVDVYWSRDFGTITFRVGTDVFEASWRIGAEPSKVVTLPSAPRDVHVRTTVWLDADAGAWRYSEIEYPADDAAEWKYFVRVFQHDAGSGTWHTLTDVETHGCEQGDGSSCGAEAARFTEGRRGHVLATEIGERMRLGPLLDDLRVEFHESMENEDLWLELGGAEVSVVPLFGDSLHAMAPVLWRSGGASAVLFPAGQEHPCMDQVGLARTGRYLLVATEWYGRCGRVVDLVTGATIHELPPGSAQAVVVPWPEERREPGSPAAMTRR